MSSWIKSYYLGSFGVEMGVEGAFPNKYYTYFQRCIKVDTNNLSFPSTICYRKQFLEITADSLHT